MPFVKSSYVSANRNIPSTDFEEAWWSKSLNVAGVDEAGRGALAGPVVAAAVILNPENIPAGLADSKVLKKGTREILARVIKKTALAIGTGVVDHTVIDRINILQATYVAMHQALENLTCLNTDLLFEHILVDGNRFIRWKLPHTCIVRGDSLSASIAAASIIAKTLRDDIMSNEMHTLYPLYGFDQHKGYGTSAHRTILKANGPCTIHRKTFITKIIA